ncbi:hypothetical protein RAH32_09710 [Paracoccus sp. WLY502]|uniref:hypothetical protein n=1 Tax=Paracoccus yibinensis TaxID=3068891 RepID=UPI002796B1DC|nr:hypothetical protein [Paracoccus sp. WLY502]MDQ1900715.1 hypothetical protein [Paracoccus sp. WLY502]
MFETNLLGRLEEWIKRLAAGDASVPRVVLLVGGPGNGKTEAVEWTVEHLDDALGCAGGLIKALFGFFHPESGIVPRLVSIDAGALSSSPRQLHLDLVQDASVGAIDGRTPAMLLVEELEQAVAASNSAYLCCVNRGVLDDAMIHAIDNDLQQPRDLLEEIARAVSLAPNAPTCWPLERFPVVAVWPMDAESLLEPTDNGDDAPARKILDRAIEPSLWPAEGTCPAGPACPFCASRKMLASHRESTSLLTILRWFELGRGKRWAFRDLFSLTSYLLAGSGSGFGSLSAEPCVWAAAMVEKDREASLGGRPRRDSAPALFWLVAAQYQHALFSGWDKRAASSLLRDIRELGLHEQSATAMGLHYFLQSRSGGHVPAMIAPLLEGLVDLLDPAMASPDAEVALWGGTLRLAELDTRFSRSVREGLEFAISKRALSSNERMLLERLAGLDELLASPRLRSKKPTSAMRIQRLVRDFSCRLVRRSIGTRQAVVPSAGTLAAFQRVVADADGHGHDLREIAKQVEDLLNNDHNFDVSLTTTFGQPLPPTRRRATLVVSRRRVVPKFVAQHGRPQPSICFLDVDLGGTAQSFALTYDLFKAVSELETGLSPASLPRSVLALLDTTRARMSGWIVRDRDALERPLILLGDSTTIESYRGHFVANKRGGRK